MTYSQAVARIQDIEARMSELAELRSLTPEQDAEFAELRDEVVALNEHRKRLERADDLAKVKSVKGQVDAAVRHYQGSVLRTERGSAGSSQAASGDYDRDAILEPDSIEDRRFRNPWNLSEMRTWGREPGAVADEYRARALAAIEKMPCASDKVRSAATDIIENFDSKDSKLARHALATSSPAYLRAWSKMATNKAHTLSQEEQRALAAVEEYRAMSLTDNAGGYLVPFQLDPTVIVTSSGVLSEIRSAARVVVATGDVWHGVSSQNVTWSFDPEGSEVSDDSPSFAQPSIPNYMARGFIPISIEAMADEQNVAQNVAMLLAGGKQDLEGTKLILGSGSAEPTGLITALAAAGGSVVVNSATTDTFALADVYALHGALPARYRANASWIANNLIYHKIRQFDTAGGAALWAHLGEGRPRALLERDVLEAEAMDGTITASAENYALAIGDFQNFVITDRLGMAIEFIPHLVGSSRRPTGQRGWFAYYRVGSDVVNPNAFRLLNIT
ncbi:capsid protein [Mycobacterium palustre]|uniref:Capsid protein n=2 Tax=Mycobacterium palustre TaxID=153971 RepID=A0A1X1ZCM3_9MYCO|nr:capsid protein [Mycobacterium palustre]